MGFRCLNFKGAGLLAAAIVIVALLVGERGPLAHVSRVLASAAAVSAALILFS
jgi:hypothetical protein